MITRLSFNFVDADDQKASDLVHMDARTLLTLFATNVQKRFCLLTGQRVIFHPLSPPLDDERRATSLPMHPACSDFASTEYCRESWRAHLEQLNASPRSHWHRCDYGKLCAIVPVCHQGRCLAVFKLVCDQSVETGVFESYVHALDLLLKHEMEENADRWAKLLRLQNVSLPDDAANLRIKTDPTNGAVHPKVHKAIWFIERHLSDTDLSVGRIAEALAVHPDYLAHLFAEQVGERMSHYIASRRMEAARNLLATTDWQIKQIAFATGYANPKWFSKQFRDFTRLTPTQFRDRVRQNRLSNRAS